jgi:YfiR/HmsC-like
VRAAAREPKLLRVVTLALFVALLSGARNEPSKSRHAAIVARVLGYELTLEERAGNSVEIAVVYRADDATSEANADDWLYALHELLPVNVKNRPLLASKVPYGINELKAAIDGGADMLLVADGLQAETPWIAKVARSRHVLTAGDSPAYVQQGLTLCVTEEAGKTKILINLNAANAEGVRFGSRLLALASLIR